MGVPDNASSRLKPLLQKPPSLVGRYTHLTTAIGDEQFDARAAGHQHALLPDHAALPLTPTAATTRDERVHPGYSAATRAIPRSPHGAYSRPTPLAHLVLEIAMPRPSHAVLGVVLAGLALTHTTPAAAVKRLWPTPDQWQRLHASSATDPAWRAIEAAQARLADAARAQGAHPLDNLSTGGRLHGDPVKAATETSLGDMPRIQALALRFALQGERADALAAGDQLAQWAAHNVPNGNPIDETGLEPAIFAYRIVRPALPDAQRRAIDAWMRRIADAEIGSRDLKRKTATNNWHSHRLKTVGMIGAALDDTRLLDYARAGFRQQIADNLLPDGRSIDFVERDALSYHVYD
ncbi:MAG: alginate lyase family protein, partial [Xanthomonas sp.]